MGRVTCAVEGCSNFKNGVSSSSFFRIFAGNRCVESWLKFCGNSLITKASMICSRHFKESDFHNPGNKSQGLYLHARPTLFPPASNPCRDETVSSVAYAMLENDDDVLYAPEDMEIGGEVELGSTSDNIFIPTTQNIEKKENAERIAHDHNYFLDMDRVMKTMERCTQLEKENVDLRNKLRSKNKYQSKLKTRNRILTTEIKKLKSLLKSQTSKLHDPVLLELQRNKTRKLHGARYSAEMRNMSIILHYCSTKAYRQMRKYFTLPSVESIKRWLSKVEIKEGYSSVVLKLLEFKAAGLSHDEKIVTVFVDEMSVAQRLSYCANAKPDYFSGFPTKVGNEEIDIKQRASSALTVMIKSIKSGFKQPIGYFFNSSLTTSRLRSIVEEGIKLVIAAGFIPKLLVCDQNSTNRSLFKTYGVTVEQPWFVLRGHKVFCAYDAPHLVKSSRNNLLKHNAVMDGKISSFQHIISLYNEDIKHIPRAVPKLTHNHIELAPYAEMRVGLATQTLSESVCAGIKTYVHTKKMAQNCLNTASYCENFDKLFDCANSTTFNETKDLKRPLMENSTHWSFLNRMKEKLKTLRFISKECFDLKKEQLYPKLPAQSRRPYFVDGWLLYIAAIEALWKDVHDNHGLAFLRTRNLSQDCLEHFFSIIRWKNCNNNHPDPGKFSSAYKAIVINQLMAPKKLGNVEADLNKYFVNMKEMTKVQILDAQRVSKRTHMTERNIKMNVNQANTVHYTSGWVSTKLKHLECIDRMHADQQKVPSKASILLNFKKFKPQSKLYSPGLNMFKFCKKIVSVFQKNFEIFIKNSAIGVKKKILEVIFWPYHGNNDELVYNVLCVPCAKLLADKYINMLIKAKLQVINTNIRVKNQIKRKSNKDKKILAKRRKLNINT